jgi:GTPase involved in cell partitioning and DNA repair
MTESLVFVLLTLVGGVVLTWYLMNRRVKNIHEQLSDKQVVINELATYAEKISNEQETVIVKKTNPKTVKKKETSKKKVSKPVEKKPKKTKKTKTNGEV